MWKLDSLEELFERLNKIEYVILRSYDNLQVEIANGGDIDILCESKDEAANQIHAYPRVPGNEVFNYYTMVADKKIPIDIREVGDGYYDEAWERSILRNRVRTADHYIMDDENYKYSLLYHALIHKPVIAQKYMKILENMFGMPMEESSRAYRILGEYLCKMRYSVSIPVDTGVEFNKENCRKLCEAMKGITS